MYGLASTRWTVATWHPPEAPKNSRTAADTASTSSLVSSGKTGRQSTSSAAAVETGRSPSRTSTSPFIAG